MKRFTFIDRQTRPQRGTATNTKQKNVCVVIVSDLNLNLKKTARP
jgi:hypothetical protein